MEFTWTRDGRRLHYLVEGTGSRTVVFEAGVGATHNTWGLVQPPVAEITRTISYDRAGYGQSDTDRAPRTVQRMADDLEDLLTADGERGYVLVGHSLGGAIIRCLAYRRPDLVAGLVLVDQVAEDCEVYYRKPRNRCVVAGYRFAALLAATGLLKPTTKRLYNELPLELAARMRADAFAVTTMRTGAAEAKAMAAGLGGLLETRGRQGLPDTPLTVISGGSCGPFEAKIRPVVVASHRRFAAEAPHGRHVVSNDSGHLIPLDDPAVIIAETSRLLSTSEQPG